MKAFIEEHIEFIIGLMGSILAATFAFLKRQYNRLNYIENFCKASLRKQIKADCKLYICQGFFPMEDREELETDIELYERLAGKNGYIDDLVEKAKALPFEKQEK